MDCVAPQISNLEAGLLALASKLIHSGFGRRGNGEFGQLLSGHHFVGVQVEHLVPRPIRGRSKVEAGDGARDINPAFVRRAIMSRYVGERGIAHLIVVKRFAIDQDPGSVTRNSILLRKTVDLLRDALHDSNQSRFGHPAKGETEESGAQTFLHGTIVALGLWHMLLGRTKLESHVQGVLGRLEQGFELRATMDFVGRETRAVETAKNDANCIKEVIRLHLLEMHRHAVSNVSSNASKESNAIGPDAIHVELKILVSTEEALGDVNYIGPARDVGGRASGLASQRSKIRAIDSLGRVDVFSANGAVGNELVAHHMGQATVRRTVGRDSESACELRT